MYLCIMYLPPYIFVGRNTWTSCQMSGSFFQILVLNKTRRCLAWFIKMINLEPSRRQVSIFVIFIYA